ncbi:GNAT family N-acetyltransferase [Natronorubrum sp. DTA28]|uniref:GNAT family N-acetyltransferase n=1 Tax=Natronorubrum sp. DTA28 TaxID=3447019 RepID=UPI003F865CCD
MEPIVREAVRPDAESVANMHEKSIRELAQVAYSRDVVSAWAAGKDPDKYQIESDETYFLVAEINDGLVGFGELRPEAEEYFQADVEGEIRAVYVHPDFTRHGVGTAIYQELESEARRLQLDSLGLWASINARGFYEGRGFETVEEITHKFGGEVEGPAVEMKKTL